MRPGLYRGSSSTLNPDLKQRAGQEKGQRLPPVVLMSFPLRFLGHSLGNGVSVGRSISLVNREVYVVIAWGSGFG